MQNKSTSVILILEVEAAWQVSVEARYGSRFRASSGTVFFPVSSDLVLIYLDIRMTASRVKPARKRLEMWGNS